MKNRCIIFPHIPKCGGTSLKQKFEKSNLRIYFDYEFPPHDSLEYYNKLCKRRNSETALLNFKEFNLVFGHFPLIRYQRKNYQYITLIRHPLDRAASHYFYWKNVLPISNQVALFREPIIKEIKNGTVNFLDFIKIKKINKVYLSYLSTFKPSDFLLVGFTDNYSSFLHRLSEYLEIDLSNDIHERKGINEHIPDIQMRQAERMLRSEIERYEEFRNYWGE